jgi:fluoroacetyl-CoA thioesterase
VKPTLVPGLARTAALRVTEDPTVSHVSPRLPALAGLPDVFVTALMIAFTEATCVDLLSDLLDADETTVGTHVDLSHVAATPPGMTVTAAVKLTSVDRRALSFVVELHDEAGPTCKGTHRRSVVTASRFTARVTDKARGAGTTS